MPPQAFLQTPRTTPSQARPALPYNHDLPSSLQEVDQTSQDFGIWLHYKAFKLDPLCLFESTTSAAEEKYIRFLFGYNDLFLQRYVESNLYDACKKVYDSTGSKKLRDELRLADAQDKGLIERLKESIVTDAKPKRKRIRRIRLRNKNDHPLSGGTEESGGFSVKEAQEEESELDKRFAEERNEQEQEAGEKKNDIDHEIQAAARGLSTMKHTLKTSKRRSKRLRYIPDCPILHQSRKQ